MKMQVNGRTVAHVGSLTEAARLAETADLGDWQIADLETALREQAEAGVRAEAARRLIALTGARDAAHLALRISNATREAIRLVRKGEAYWSPAEAARAAELEAMDRAIEAIRAASNALEGQAEIPADFANDQYWPQFTPASAV